ncbi:MAG TPA: ABC transporter substrate-binding protein [Terracidiphilus sp.]|nr:ABC transporter substrate-binding protein [Terracidiphilus sp.]
MLRRFAISGFAAALALGLMASDAGARTRPHYGGTLRVEIAGDAWQGPGGLARSLVLDGLTALSPAGEVRPSLAVAWSADDAAHRWQFQLRPGVHFQDGSPLTSDAVVASLNLACASGCPWSVVHAVGPSVVFTSDSPLPNLPALLAGDRYLIALAVAKNGQAPRNPVGTGPFAVSSSANGALTLVANNDDWQGRPFLDTIQILSHRSIRDQWLDLAIGRADVVEVPPERLRQAREQQFTVLESPPVTLLALQVADTGALSNPALRAALAQAVDRSALFNVIFQKQGAITASLLPQSFTGYAFLFPAARNLNKARELRGGLSAPQLSLAVAGDSAMQLAAQRLALNLQEAGLSVRVVQAASTTHPALALVRLPLTGSSPPAMMETLLRSAGVAAPVVAQDSAGLYKTERDFLALHTILPLLDLPRAYAISARVRDLRLRADGTSDLADASLEDAP